MTRQQKYETIVWCRAHGWTRQEIGALLGLKVSGVSNLINDPDGSKQQSRRERYRGTCRVCGKPTDGSSGFNAPTLCARHNGERTRIWTRESIIEAIQRFARENGKPPVASDWNHPGRGEGYPPLTCVYRSSTSPGSPFASWADAIEAAGFPRPRVGHYDRSRKKVSA